MQSDTSKIGGVLFQGIAGIGKSKLARAYLLSQGYTKGNIEDLIDDKDEEVEIDYDKIYNQAQHTPNIFYVIDGVTPRQFNQISVAIYHSGAKAIMDEFNAQCKEGELFNNLFAGLDPKCRATKHPGAKFILTQNPSHFGSDRNVLTLPILNRLDVIEMKNYLPPEVFQILKATGLTEYQARVLLNEFYNDLDYGQKHRKYPLPTLRLLFAEALSMKLDDSVLGKHDGIRQVLLEALTPNKDSPLEKFITNQIDLVIPILYFHLVTTSGKAQNFSISKEDFILANIKAMQPEQLTDQMQEITERPNQNSI